MNLIRHDRVLCGALFLAAIPWLILQTQIRIPSDAAWLIQAAEHFWNGQKLSEYYFDTNPPMCFLVYLPVVWLKALGLPSWQALNLYVFSFNLITIGLCHYYLKFWSNSAFQRYAILVAYAFATTMFLILGYGQKDHLIAIALLPFCLAQFAITRHHNIDKRILFFTFVLLTPFLLIKPHYGLLPTVILLHRFIRGGGVKVVQDPDFLILSASVLLYGGIIWVYFQDFLQIVLPLSLKIYVGTEGIYHSYKSLILTFVLLSSCALIVWLSRNAREEKTLPYILIGLALLGFIPFWVQAKGFLLHFLPFLILFITAIIAAISLPLSRVFNNKRLSAYHLIWLLPALSACFLILKKPDDTYKHAYYNDHFLTELVQENPDYKSFFFESNSTQLIKQIEEYSGQEHASRFSGNWFIPNEKKLGTEDYKFYWQLMGDYLAADFQQYKPGVIMLISPENKTGIEAHFGSHENFQNALSAYRFSGYYEDSELYYGIEKLFGTKTLRYKIYKRKK